MTDRTDPQPIQASDTAGQPPDVGAETIKDLDVPGEGADDVRGGNSRSRGPQT